MNSSESNPSSLPSHNVPNNEIERLLNSPVYSNFLNYIFKVYTEEMLSDNFVTCSYFKESEFNHHALSSKHKAPSSFHVNVRSLPKNHV